MLRSDSPARSWLAPASLVALAVLATFNAIPNGFTYDDRFIIVGNPAVARVVGWEQFLLLPYWPLQQGGDGYRPLATLLFAIEWAVSHEPELFHVVTMALYAGCTLLVWWLARMFTSRAAAWWSAALFAVHPVHVEVTGGVVGQSELLALITILLATGLYVAGRRRGALGRPHQVAIATLFLLGCLAKEHVLMLPLVLAAAELFLVPGERGLRDRFRAVGPLLVALAIIGIAVFMIRALVIPLGALGFSPFTPFASLKIDAWGRAVTMLGIVPHWARLLLWPSRLSTEYGPPAYPVGSDIHPVAILGLLCVAGFIALFLRSRRDRPELAFCMLWTALLIAPVSNVLFPTGVLLAERTLFAPSVGVCIALGMGVAASLDGVLRHASLPRVAALVGAGALLIFGTARSIVRLSDWRDNQSLFEAGIRAEPNVYRAHYMLGAWFLETGRWSLAHKRMTRALELFDRDPAVPYNLGLGYFFTGDYRRATEMFQRADSLMPGALDAKTKLALSYAAEGRYDEAQKAAGEALRTRSLDPAALQGVLQAALLARKSAARGTR